LVAPASPAKHQPAPLASRSTSLANDLHLGMNALLDALSSV